jgi:hypothetical protein
LIRHGTNGPRKSDDTVALFIRAFQGWPATARFAVSPRFSAARDDKFAAS